jgi:hypothetical protein
LYKSKYQVVAFLALSLLAACSSQKSEQSAPPSGEFVPKNIQFTKPPVGPELSKEQAALVKKEFTVNSTMVLPPGELIFPDKNSSAADLAKKEAELKQKDPNSFALLTDIRSSCKKGHPTVKFDTTFPTDEVKDENDLWVNDKVEGSGTAALVGSACPVEYSGGIGFSGVVTDKNDVQKEISGKAGYNFKMNAVMKNSQYAKLLGARGMILESSIDGLAVRRDVVVSKFDRALITYNIHGSYLSLKSEIPFSIEVKALAEGNSKSPVNSKVDMVAAAKIQMPGFSVDIVFHQISQDDTILSKEIYLNGHSITEAQLNELFGANNPIAMTQKNEIIKTLK